MQFSVMLKHVVDIVTSWATARILAMVVKRKSPGAQSEMDLRSEAVTLLLISRKDLNRSSAFGGGGKFFFFLALSAP
jgi:hypothetical protein